MQLWEAVEAFKAFSPEKQSLTGIGEPHIRTLDGRPVAIGYLNSTAIRRLIETGNELPHPHDKR